MSELRIRNARREDLNFIVSLVPRLTEFELPVWREPKAMNRADEEVLRRVLSDDSLEAVIFIAEDGGGNPLGFIHLNVAEDYYTRERHGHISDVVVASEGEGRGAGKALMKAAEDWVRMQGFRWLTLNVFTRNTRAKALYEKLGYGEETIKYLKELNEPEN